MNKQENPTGATNPNQKQEKWQVDAFAVDWPLAGEEEMFANDLRVATLEALNKWDRVDNLRITSEVSNVQEGEGLVPPRVLSLRKGKDWFINKKYFTIDVEKGLITPTNKWMEKFQKVTE